MTFKPPTMPTRSMALYRTERPEQVANSTFYQIILFYDPKAAEDAKYVVRELQGWFGLTGTVITEMMKPEATFQFGYPTEEEANRSIDGHIAHRVSEGFVYGSQFNGPLTDKPYTKISFVG
jgi:hypothetical protein